MPYIAHRRRAGLRPLLLLRKARAHITIDGASAVRTAMRSVKISIEDTKRLLKPITAVKAENLFRPGKSDGSATLSSSFCLMNPHVARILLFILRGVGDDQIKAVEIARALERAVCFDFDVTAPEQLEIAAFAIEAVRCFVGEKLASSAEITSGKFAFDAFLNAMKSQISVSVKTPVSGANSERELSAYEITAYFARKSFRRFVPSE